MKRTNLVFHVSWFPLGNIGRPPIRTFVSRLEAIEPARRKFELNVWMEFTHQLHRSSTEPVVLDFEPLRLKLSELGNKFLFNIGPKQFPTSSFNSFATLASIKNLLLVFYPLVEATFGNTKLLARSVLVAAVLMVICSLLNGIGTCLLAPRAWCHRLVGSEKSRFQ